MLSFLDGKKTYLAAAGLALTALGGFMTNDLTLLEALALFLNGAGFAGLKASK
jgi:hypothetical protein